MTPEISDPAEGPVSFHGDVPVTVVVTRTVKTGREGDFERWIHGVGAVSMRFEGHLGLNVIRPRSPSRDYVLIFRFNRHANLKRWMDSDERAKWLKDAEELHEGPAKVQHLTGLEAWFSLPDKPPMAPPPRYKMALLSFVAIFPLINLLNAFVVPLLGELPGILRTLIVMPVTITLMTYVVMPSLTRIFYRWLFPSAP